MRRLACALLCAAAHTMISAAPPAEPATKETGYTFEGRLGYYLESGAFVPIVPDRVLVGWGLGACQWSLQHTETLEVEPNGHFRIPVVAEVSLGMTRMAVLHGDGSDDPPTCFETRGWPCYRFRAKGCDDRTLQFGPEPPSAVVNMDCSMPRPQ